MDNSSLRDLVEFMAKSLVDNPDQVEVTEIVGEQTTVVELRFSLIPDPEGSSSSTVVKFAPFQAAFRGYSPSRPSS